MLICNPNSKIKLVILTLFFIFSSVAFFAVYDTLKKTRKIASPIAESSKAEAATNKNVDETIEDNTENTSAVLTTGPKELSELKRVKNDSDPADTSKNFNILILGIDRRYGGQTHWRTDVIQLLTLSPDRSKAVITHIPRDVWAGDYKINAIYNIKGPEAMKDIVEEITGQRPDRIIRVDFDAFVWLVDSVGGLTINVPRGFTDTKYPNDREGLNGTKTVTFEAGQQTMDGERALIYARSRKGNNGEGSDYARGTRQQIVMQSLIDDFFKPGNLFNPKTAETLYKIATKKVYTDISLNDTKILFDVLKNYENITVTKLSLDTSNYLKVPEDRSAYNGAWTLIPKGTYEPIHEAISSKL